MKRAFIVSTAINFVLLGTVIWFASRKSNLRWQPIEKSAPAKIVSASANFAPAFHWRQVESDDYRKYIANLRAIGCPEETIRDIIIADVNKLYAARRAELLGASPKTFWQSADPLPGKLKQRRQEITRDLEKEKRELIRTLLGIDLDQELASLGDSPEVGGADLSFLPADTQARVKAAREKFGELQQALLREAEEENRAADWKKLKELYQQHEAELALLLSPAELEEYQLRFHPAAENLRRNLVGFHPDEQEFRDLFRTMQPIEDKFAFVDPADTAAQQARSAELQQIEAEIRKLLGEDRYADYQRSGNGRFQNLYGLAQRYDLPEESAVKIYEGNRAIQNDWAKIERDPAYTAQQREILLRQYQNQIQTLVQQTLGERAYRYYQRWGNENWIGN